MNGYVYLASPYTAYNKDGDFDEKLMQHRYEEVLKCAAHLTKSGLIIYCPIAISHAMDKYLGRLSPKFWYRFDEVFVKKASYLFILCLDGWAESAGIATEVKIAEDLEMPIVYINSNLE